MLEMAQKLLGDLPEHLNFAREDITKTVRLGLDRAFARLDLVTRESFEVQKQVLAKTQAQLAALEARVIALEQGKSHELNAAPST
jgi:BMFP domain-containing protein YqiC